MLMAKDPPPITVLHPGNENEELSKILDLLISNCTQLETSKRYQNAAAVLGALEANIAESSMPDSLRPARLAD